MMEHYTLEKIEENGSSLKVYTNKGTVDTDMVILAIGVKPESSIAKNAGLSVNQRGAIIVDDNKVETFVDGITKDDFGTVPHLFSNGSLCLYYQFGEKPEFSFLNCSASDYLAWVTKWLLFYELWKVTGEWYGGGIGHD